MSKAIVSELAWEDIMAIDDFTIMRFGVRQAVHNREVFDETFQFLAANPQIGHVREDLTPHGRNYKYWTVMRRFMIVYEPVETGVRIVRVLDGAQDISEILADDS